MQRLSAGILSSSSASPGEGGSARPPRLFCQGLGEVSAAVLGRQPLIVNLLLPLREGSCEQGLAVIGPDTGSDYGAKNLCTACFSKPVLEV